MRIFNLCALLVAMLCIPVSADPGQVNLNSAPGKVCEGCDDNIHWYQQESLRAERYAQNPPKMPEPMVCNKDTPDISCSGKQMRGNKELYQFPGLVYVLVYLEVDNRVNNPWRFALAQIRDANNVFQRSGVPVQFIVTEIAVVDNGKRSMQGILDSLRGRAAGISQRNGADLVIGILPKIWGYWSYCGLATLGTGNPWPMSSVTACYNNGNNTLAHEIGHNFGLNHDVGNRSFIQGGVGFKDHVANKGTIMSYSDSRVPFFSSPKLKYKGKVYGSEEADAVSALNDTLGNIAMAHETMMEQAANNPNASDSMLNSLAPPIETVYCPPRDYLTNPTYSVY